MRDKYGDIIFSKMPTTALHTTNEIDIRKVLEILDPIKRSQREWFNGQPKPIMLTTAANRLKRKFR